MKLVLYGITISIHAPREGGDAKQKQKTKEQNGFQSTPPARGATMILRRGSRNFLISIHAPREGGDITNFVLVPRDRIFQSTPPARGATLLFFPDL